MRSTLLSSLAFLLLAGPALAVQDAEAAPADSFEGLEWREVGPFRGGRSAAVCGVPTQPLTFWFGSTGGGVWKTLDGGTSWANVSDGFFGGSIGAVAVSEWDPNVVYVGGGEKTVRGNTSHGDGVWRSLDAGETWEHVGLGDSRHVPRIRIHPRDPDLVYAAVLGHLYGPNDERGVYRSTDGGASWERVLFVSDEVGAVDLAMDPTNPRVLYASFWRVIRRPYALESGGEGSGIWKSTDGGDSWVELTANPGLPDGPIGISGVSVSGSNGRNVYAIVEAEEGGVFRSRDGGATWKRTNSQRDLRQRAWYYTRIYADPADEETVYVPNVRFHRSKDGGVTFTEIPTPHGDNHDLWIDPAEPKRMIEANDGGANVSFDGGETWSTQSNQPTAQMYRVSTDDDFPYRLLGGQQDNSTVRLSSRSLRSGSIGTRDWEPTAGGESGHVVARPGEPHVVFGGSYGGYLTRYDHRTGQSRTVTVWPDDPMGHGAEDATYRFNWNFPLFFSPHDQGRLYAAGNVLFTTTNDGESWTSLGGDLTRNDLSKLGSSGGPITQDNTSVEYYGTIFAAFESPHEAGVLWCGSDDGLVHLSRDGGSTWADVTPGGSPEWMQVNCLEPHPTEPGGAYLAATRYKLDDFRPYLFRTTDWGRTWTEITNGIDPLHFTRAIRADPERPGLLFAGTERGVYVSFDDGGAWAPLQLDLPIVPITDLAIAGGDLVAATQGRGYWILDDLGPLRQHRPGDEDRVRLYRPRPTHRIATRRSDDPGSAGTNPHPGVLFTYYLAAAPEPDEAVRLEIFQDGLLVRVLERAPAEGEEPEPLPKHLAADDRVVPAEAGYNRVAWDLRHVGAESFDGLVMWNRDLKGPMCVPGTYRARLTVGDEYRDVDFEVLPDPRSSATAEDRFRQLRFLLDVRGRLTTVHRAIRRTRLAREQIESLRGRLEDGGPLAVEADAILEEMKAAEEALYQTSNESPQDPLNFPIRLNDKLAGLAGVVGQGDAAPTQQAEVVRAELSAAIDAELDRLDAVFAERLPAFNDAVLAASVPPITTELTDETEEE